MSQLLWLLDGIYINVSYNILLFYIYIYILNIIYIYIGFYNKGALHSFPNKRIFFWSYFLRDKLHIAYLKAAATAQRSKVKLCSMPT